MLSKEDRKKVHKAKLLWDQDKVDDAWDIIRRLMLDHPFERDLLQLAGVIYEKANNMPVAYHMLRQSTKVDPDESSCWLNFGRVAEALWRTDEAEVAYKKSLRLAGNDDIRRCTLGNLAALCIDNGRYAEAEEWAKKALDEFPDFAGARSNLGFSQLGLGNFAEGWKNYRLCVGTSARAKFQYKGEPEWDGTPGKTVVLYGEQGIGDEICFASMIPDAIRDCKKVIIDCDVRLAHLFQRSFPGATVYGTRQAKASDLGLWKKEDREFDCSMPLAQLGEYYRTSRESFPRKPYLIPEQDRLLMWKSLFATKKKPIIGIAWSGGIPKTGARFRRCELEEWSPLFKAIDAHYVSLQYKSAAVDIEDFSSHGVDLMEYPFATITRNYDDTAAMVAAMDCIIGVPTAVIHLGGALGVPTFAMCAKMKCWKYNQGNLFQPVNMIEWAGSWENTIRSAIPQIEELCKTKGLMYSSDSTTDNQLLTTPCNFQSSGAQANQLQ